MSQTPSPEEETSLSGQSESDQGIVTSQGYSYEPNVPQCEQLDIGPGGIIIPDSPNNRELLERIAHAPVLTPIELYKLAVSYQQVVSNSGLGNRLAFIGLNAIFQHTLILALIDAKSAEMAESLFDPCTWCALGIKPPGCNCANLAPTTDSVKSVSYDGVELLIQITRVEEHTAYIILGVGPNYVALR